MIISNCLHWLRVLLIKLTPKSIGCILHILYHGLTLSEIEMTNEEVFSRIYLPSQGPPMINTKL